MVHHTGTQRTLALPRSSHGRRAPGGGCLSGDPHPVTARQRVLPRPVTWHGRGTAEPPAPAPWGRASPGEGSRVPPRPPGTAWRWQLWAGGNDRGAVQAAACPHSSSRHSIGINYTAKAIRTLGSLACWRGTGKASQRIARGGERGFGGGPALRGRCPPPHRGVPSPTEGPTASLAPGKGSGAGCPPQCSRERSPRSRARSCLWEQGGGPTWGPPHVCEQTRGRGGGAGAAQGLGAQADAPGQLHPVPAAGLPGEK